MTEKGLGKGGRARWTSASSCTPLPQAQSQHSAPETQRRCSIKMLVQLNWPLAVLPLWGSHSNQLSRMLPLQAGLEAEEAWRNRLWCANTIVLSFPLIRPRSQGVCGHTTRLWGGPANPGSRNACE